MRRANLGLGWTFAVVLLLPACQEHDQRFERLADLAAVESRDIAEPLARLTRLLKLAQSRQWRGTAASAAASRDDVRAMLLGSHAPALTEESQLAGWISLSQFARAASSTAEALEAGDRALAMLRSLQPAAERAKYVQSVAVELIENRGRGPTVELFRESAQWAAEIQDLRKRRGAYAAISYQAVTLNDLELAAEIVRRDEDRTWRAAVFTWLADNAPYANSGVTSLKTSRQQGSLGFTPSPPASEYSSARPPEAGAYSAESFEWKPLDFDSYFKSK